MATLSESISKVNLESYLQTNHAHQECKNIANSLRDFGAVLVYDPRVKTSDSDSFINLLEKYFAQPREIKLKDARPHYYYQVRIFIINENNTFDK